MASFIAPILRRHSEAKLPLIRYSQVPQQPDVGGDTQHRAGFPGHSINRPGPGHGSMAPLAGDV